MLFVFIQIVYMYCLGIQNRPYVTTYVVFMDIGDFSAKITNSFIPPSLS